MTYTSSKQVLTEEYGITRLAIVSVNVFSVFLQGPHRQGRNIRSFCLCFFVFEYLLIIILSDKFSLNIE